MDYQKIIDDINENRAKDILRKLDIDFEDRGSYLIMQTFCHNHKSEDASKKLYYYKNNKIFMCYTSCGSMSWFKFLKSYYESQEITYDWHNDIYNLLVSPSAGIDGFKVSTYKYNIERYVPTEIPELPIYNNYVMECFQRYYPIEWIEDGILPATMDKFNIKYDSIRNKIIIPHYNASNQLIGIRARSLNEDDIEQYGKYMPICMEGKWYSHPLSLNAYGLNWNKKEINKYKQVIIFESEKSVMQFDSFNLPNVSIAACGSNFNKYLLLLLLKECPNIKEVIIAFDKEELPGKTDYYNKLRGICKKYEFYCNFSFIYDRTGLLNLKDSPADKGEEVFRELYNKRIKIY